MGADRLPAPPGAHPAHGVATRASLAFTAVYLAVVAGRIVASARRRDPQRLGTRPTDADLFARMWPVAWDVAAVAASTLTLHIATLGTVLAVVDGGAHRRWMRRDRLVANPRVLNRWRKLCWCRAARSARWSGRCCSWPCSGRAICRQPALAIAFPLGRLRRQAGRASGNAMTRSIRRWRPAARRRRGCARTASGRPLVGVLVGPCCSAGTSTRARIGGAAGLVGASGIGAGARTAR